MKQYNIQKIIFTLSLLSLFVVLLLSCGTFDPCDNDEVHNTDHVAKEDFSYEIETVNQNNFTLEGINGSIDITGITGATSVKIWGEKRVESESKSDANQCLENLKVLVDNRHDGIFVETLQPNESHGPNYIVTYHAIVPTDWDISISDINGEIEIKDITGRITSHLINGEIHLKNIHSSAISADLVNGDIDGRINLPIDGICKLESINGQIHLGIPTDTSARVVASVANGTVNIHGLILTNLESSKNSVSGILGGGQGNINLHGVNGTIVINGFLE